MPSPAKPHSPRHKFGTDLCHLVPAVDDDDDDDDEKQMLEPQRAVLVPPSPCLKQQSADCFPLCRIELGAYGAWVSIVHCFFCLVCIWAYLKDMCKDR